MTTLIDKTQIPEGWLMDSKGRLVHQSQISQVDLLMDQTVAALFALIEPTAASLAKLKAALFGDLEMFAELVADRFSVQLDGASGNLTLTSYDGCRKIERENTDRVTAGPEIHAAEALVREILAEIDNDVARAVADRAFRRNPKTKELSVSRLQDLIGADIPDERWKRAQRAVRESLRSAGTVTYFRAYRRERPDQRWQQVALDFSAIQPAKDATTQEQAA